MPSRNIDDLTPSLKEKYTLFNEAMKKAGIPFIVTCTARRVEEQIMLFCQGRMKLDDVNRVRSSLHEIPIKIEQNNKIVTWTLDSKHIPLVMWWNKSKAFDIAIIRNGTPFWDIKVSVNDNDIPDYIEAGGIGKSVGLKWGGDFKNPDYPHFEE